MSWLLPDDAVRGQRLERGFSLYLRRMWMPRELTFTTAGLVGGAAWMAPGAWHLSLARQLLMLPGMVRVFRGELARALRAFAVVESKHPREPHYYLHALGVAVEWQGRGLGSALMAPVLERCDVEGLGAYLEASSARSRMLYERHGFEVTEEFDLPDGPPLWRMWRTPVRAAH
jgi:GNAT superfamily N-acetyltransferase